MSRTFIGDVKKVVEFLRLISISLIHSLCEFLLISSSAHLLLLQIIYPRLYISSFWKFISNNTLFL